MTINPSSAIAAHRQGVVLTKKLEIQKAAWYPNHHGPKFTMPKCHVHAHAVHIMAMQMTCFNPSSWTPALKIFQPQLYQTHLVWANFSEPKALSTQLFWAKGSFNPTSLSQRLLQPNFSEPKAPSTQLLWAKGSFNPTSLSQRLLQPNFSEPKAPSTQLLWAKGSFNPTSLSQSLLQPNFSGPKGLFSNLLWPKGLSSNLFWSNFLSITLVLQNVMTHLLHWTLFKVILWK